MITWGEFEAAAPDLARLGRERFDRTEVLLIGTVRADGTARISPCEFLFLDDLLLMGMMWQSKKALDLLRDPRCTLHSTITNKDGKEGEFKLRGRAIDVVDPELRERNGQRAFENTGWRPPEPYHLFSIGVEQAAFVQYSGEGHQTVIRWREGGAVEERVRHWTGSGYEP
jgi:hypothetical protein